MTSFIIMNKYAQHIYGYGALALTEINIHWWQKSYGQTHWLISKPKKLFTNM